MRLARRLFGALLAGGLVAARHASGTEGLRPEAEPLAALNHGLLTAMKMGSGTPFDRRFETLAPVIDRVFDLPGILKTCVGPRWSTLSRPEQTALETTFRRYTIASYVASFDGYEGERFEILPDRRSIGSDEVVATRIVGRGTDVSRIDYVMREQRGGWRAIDVLLNGSISRVALQRSDFRNLLAAGDAASLIASLERKEADLSGARPDR
jgi:phospholipid transport system substrate-binding protein